MRSQSNRVAAQEGRLLFDNCFSLIHDHTLATLVEAEAK